MANELEQLVLRKAQTWLDGHYDEATKKQVKYLMDNDMKELVESFYKDLEFGTGGLRGIMGVGSNRMNVYTVGAATQGLSNYLKKNFAGERMPEKNWRRSKERIRFHRKCLGQFNIERTQWRSASQQGVLPCYVDRISMGKEWVV